MSIVSIAFIFYNSELKHELETQVHNYNLTTVQDVKLHRTSIHLYYCYFRVLFSILSVQEGTLKDKYHNWLEFYDMPYIVPSI